MPSVRTKLLRASWIDDPSLGQLICRFVFIPIQMTRFTSCLKDRCHHLMRIHILSSFYCCFLICCSQQIMVLFYPELPTHLKSLWPPEATAGNIWDPVTSPFLILFLNEFVPRYTKFQLHLAASFLPFIIPCPSFCSHYWTFNSHNWQQHFTGFVLQWKPSLQHFHLSLAPRDYQVYVFKQWLFFLLSWKPSCWTKYIGHRMMPYFRRNPKECGIFLLMWQLSLASKAACQSQWAPHFWNFQYLLEKISTIPPLHLCWPISIFCNTGYATLEFSGNINVLAFPVIKIQYIGLYSELTNEFIKLKCLF